MAELWCPETAAARLDKGVLFLLGGSNGMPRADRAARAHCVRASWSEFGAKSAHDVEDVDLREGAEIGLNAVLVLLRAKPHRLHRAHADIACAPHVGVEAVADEERLLGGHTEPLERRLKDLRPRLPHADLRREHDGVEPLG